MSSADQESLPTQRATLLAAIAVLVVLQVLTGPAQNVPCVWKGSTTTRQGEQTVMPVSKESMPAYLVQGFASIAKKARLQEG